MTYKELNDLEKQMLEDLSGFADIYGKIYDLIMGEIYRENRDLNSDEARWLSENIPY